MNAWQRQRNRNGWASGLLEWTEGKTAFLSVAFSWQISDAYQRAIMLQQQGFYVRAGGPAVDMNPDYFRGVAITAGNVNALSRHNPDATFTTRGCIRRCPFCAVPTIEGDLVELDNWEPKPIVCDNNLLAASRGHFDCVIDRLKEAGIKKVDFNQGLDARLLSRHHAGRLTELDLRVIRLAWDDTRSESQFMAAFQMLQAAGIPARKIRVYVLIGYDDDPADALYRLETVRTLGAWPNPMRYQPLNAKRRNEHVAPDWTHRELVRYMRYWSNLRHLSKIPFAEFRSRPPRQVDKRQLALAGLAETP